MPTDYCDFFNREEAKWNLSLSLDDIESFEFSTEFSDQTCDITLNNKEVNKMVVHHTTGVKEVSTLDFMYGKRPFIKKVIFNNPATIVFWYGERYGAEDKTVVKCCEDEEWNPRKGLAMAICKKFLGKEYNIFKCLEGASPEVEEKLAIWLCKRILAGYFTETFRKYIDNNPDLKEV